MSDLERHSRSILFPGIGKEGQERIGRFSIAFVGAGAVGAAAAEAALRAGFGAADDRGSRRRRAVEPRRGSFSSTPRTRPGSRPRPRRRRRGWRRSIPAIPVRAVVADLDASQRPGDPGGPRRRLRRLRQLRDPAARFGRLAGARAAVRLRGLRRRRGTGRRLRSRADAVPALLPRGPSSGRLGPDLRHGRRRADAAAARRVDRHDRGRFAWRRGGGRRPESSRSRSGTGASPRAGSSRPPVPRRRARSARRAGIRRSKARARRSW